MIGAPALDRPYGDTKVEQHWARFYANFQEKQCSGWPSGSTLDDSFYNNARTSTLRRKRTQDYFNFAYSALACLRMGMSGSASFQRPKKS
jgi:hypothetical protein